MSIFHEALMMQTAKIFRNGASQAVRLPKAFRFECDEVCVRRVGSAVILFPRDAAWDLVEEAIERIDDDFMADRDQPEGFDERASL